MIGARGIRVQKDSKITASEIQKIMDNYFFIDPIEEIFSLMSENWFLDILDELTEMNKGHYDRFKTYILSAENSTDNKTLLLGMVFCKDDYEDSFNYDSLYSEIKSLEERISQIDFKFMLLPIDDEDSFERIMAGEIFSKS